MPRQVRIDRKGSYWLVIGAGVCAALHVGKISPALPELRESLGLSLLQSGFLLSLVQLAGMLMGLLVGAAADAVGLRRSMLAGLLLLSAAGAAGGWAYDAPTMLALRALEGVGFLLVVLPAPGMIRLLAPAHRGSAAFGYWGMYMPLGTALAMLCGPLVLQVAGWRAAWWLLSAISLGMALCLWRCVSAPSSPEKIVAETSGRDAREHVGHWVARLRMTLSARGPWLLALSFAAYSSQWLAVIGFLPSMALQMGASGQAVGPVLALAALVNIIGNMASGRLLQRGRPAHLLLTIGFGAMALGAVVAFAGLSETSASLPELCLRFLGVLVFSMVGGLVPGTLFALSGALSPGKANVSTTVGWVQQWSAAGQLVGPPVVAAMASLAGGWHWTWVFAATTSALGLVFARAIAQELERQGGVGDRGHSRRK